MSLIFLIIAAYFIVRAITRASCAPRYYGQMPPPPPPGQGYGPGYYGPGPGYGPGYGYGGWGPGYYGGGNGLLTGLVAGMGGAWLGNEVFGQHSGTPDAATATVPDNQITTFDQSGNAIDPSSDPSGGTPALGDGGGGW